MTRYEGDGAEYSSDDGEGKESEEANGEKEEADEDCWIPKRMSINPFLNGFNEAKSWM